MATLKEKIIGELEKESHLSDRELTDRILGIGQPQQPVNIACRELEKKNIIRRTLRPIKNYLSNVDIGIQHHVESMNDNSNTSTNELNEEAIKQIIYNKLVSEDWQVEIAWGKTHGADVVAQKGNQKWIIEIKGCGSLNAMRVNYFLSIIGELLQRMDDSNAKYSIALPNMKQFRKLWERFPKLAKERTTISAMFISKDGSILEEN